MGLVEEADANREIPAATRVADYVFDADVHVTPPPTFWAEYLSPKFRDLAPTVESEGEFDYVVFEGERRKINLMQSQAGRTFNQYKNAGKQSDMRVGGWMPAQRLDDMDRGRDRQGRDLRRRGRCRPAISTFTWTASTPSTAGSRIFAPTPLGGFMAPHSCPPSMSPQRSG